MSNTPLIFQPLVKYVDFQGRARRSEFWLWVLLRIAVGMVMGSIMTSVMFAGLNFHNPDPSQFMSRYFSIMPVTQIVNLGLLLPSIAVAVRRLHDTNRSGWWYVMPIAVAIIGTILFFIFAGTQLFTAISAGRTMTDAQGLALAFSMIGSIFLCLFLPLLAAEIIMLIFYVSDGTPGSNRFGPDPKGRGLMDTPEVLF